jgi:hypothetical protein
MSGSNPARISMASLGVFLVFQQRAGKELRVTFEKQGKIKRGTNWFSEEQWYRLIFKVLFFFAMITTDKTVIIKATIVIIDNWAGNSGKCLLRLFLKPFIFLDASISAACETLLKTSMRIR